MKSPLNVVELVIFIATVLFLWFIGSGDPSLIELWHAKAVVSAKQECGVSK